MHRSSPRLRTLFAFAALVAAASLTACGGGGGSSSEASPTPGPAPAPLPGTTVSTAGSLQTSVPATSYAANSVQDSFFTELNALRGGAGAGLVSQSTALDTSASAHAHYLQVNAAFSHNEDPTLPAYYEATPFTRMTKAGYDFGYATEVIAGTGGSGLGSDCVRGLLSTVYHGAAVLGPTTDIGVGIATDSSGSLCVADMARPPSTSPLQVAPAGSFIAYPYAGQTDVIEIFYVNNESPRAPTSVFPNATAGTPIIVGLANADWVNAAAANVLAPVVTRFTLKDAGGNTVSAGILANTALQGGAGVTLHADSTLGTGFAALIPYAPLARNATYTVTFAATLDKSGAAQVSRTWSFTTNP
jgi:uncharacterized protein YkwD